MATNKMTTVKALEVALSYVPADMTDVEHCPPQAV